ncbi:MAG TPA: hypothetical protein VHX65_10905 [Pirellulales bacterium]|jgi:hypothetical protein|nr:hypothetical protein [Pirellulales bacterium]
MANQSRRAFLEDVGRGMLVASVGATIATDLELAPRAFADDKGPARLSFGKLDALAGLMQDIPAEKQLPILVKKLRDGTSLRELVAAGALANARQFGGHDYVGWHTFMALAPAFEMAKELPEARQALPVLKVLYRNAQTIQRSGGPQHEALKPVEPRSLAAGRSGTELLREAIQNRDLPEADAIFAALVLRNPEIAYNDLQPIVEEAIYPDADGIHCAVLAWRAWATLDLTGKEHAQTLLRQSVHFCMDRERRIDGGLEPSIRTALPRLLDRHKLIGRTAGRRPADDAWVDELARTISAGNHERAAEAVAAALAEGFDPEAVGEAISLAANHLLLSDSGRPSPIGTGGSQFVKAKNSVHGDSAGVHASDATNAWRNIARVSNSRSAFASLIVAAYNVGPSVGNFGGVGKDLYPLPEHLQRVRGKDPAALVGEAEEAIRANDQPLACAAVHRYGELGQSPRAILDILLKYAVSEDGALHAEKYYRTATEEFAAARPAFRWRQLVALARVTASEYGQPAPGYADACRLLHV